MKIINRTTTYIAALLFILEVLTLSACIRPKFELSNMVVSPNPAGAGDEITISVDITNVGSASGNYTAILIVNDDIVSESVISLDPGVTQNTTFRIVEKEVGKYTLKIEELVSILDVKKPAELELDTPVITPQEILPGETSTIRVNGYNAGGVRGTFDIDLTSNNEVIQTKAVTIESGEKIPIDFNLTLNVPGKYDIGINDRHLVLKVLKPAEFQISSLQFSPEEPVANQEVTVVAVVSNMGEVEGTHTIVLKIDGKSIESKEITVEGGDSTNVNFRFVHDLGGKHDISINEKIETLNISGPRYGGRINLLTAKNINTFDEVMGNSPESALTMQLTNEELVRGDWGKGPAGGYGIKQTTWTVPLESKDLKTGCIAESWELSEPGRIVFHIRKGIHYALNRDNEASNLVNGRELTAGDVVFSLKRIITDPRSFIYNSYSQLRQATVYAPDDSTVTVSVPNNSILEAFNLLGDYASIVPPEVVARYGDMDDWRHSVGTGPFMLTDVISGSMVTLERNYSYWMKDPVGTGKGNQLPYLDRVRILIIPDSSTRLAAFRTGHVDQYYPIAGDDISNIVQNGPISMLIEDNPDQSLRQYNCWWPWLKNYSGELTIGYYNQNWPQYVWLDLDLKEEMGY